MASTLGISEDSSCSLGFQQDVKSCGSIENQNEASLSPTRPSESPDLPKEQGTTSSFTGDTLHGTGKDNDTGTTVNGEEHNKMETTLDGETSEIKENVTTMTLDGILLTPEMQREEEELERANKIEEEQIRKEMEARALQEKELKELRYKRLMHLLNKSEFYSQFLLQQIESQKAVINVGRKKKKTVEVTSSQESSSSQPDSGSSGSVSSSGTKRKRQSKGVRASKRTRNEKYNIADVIDTDTVRAKAEEVRNEDEEDKENIDRVDQPRLFVNGTMRSYQLDGFSWLLALYENGVNGILGDEMGLGKTIQTIALLCHLIDQGVQGPFLVIGPLSTLPNWMAEFERFSPEIPTILYHGTEDVRSSRRRIMNRKVSMAGLPNPVYPVVITSYEVTIRDTKYLNKVNWRYICVDEGHRLKNHQCRLTKSLKTFNSSNRLLLTGTPLQNNLAELWALLNFLMPDIFDSLDVFEAWFDVTEMTRKEGDEKIIQQEREKQVIRTLMKILSPFFLRRVKADVDLGIPLKKELLVYTPMTPQQVKLYEATLTMNFEHFNLLKDRNTYKLEYDENGRPKRKAKKNVDKALIDETDSPKALDRFIAALQRSQLELENRNVHVRKTNLVRVKLQNRVMQLRKIVNHPYLIDYPLNKDETYKIDEGLLRSCGKLQVLDQLLTELYRRNHRVLLFSQMTQLMDILEDYLSLRPQYKYKRLDGTCSIEERQEDIKEFNEKSSPYFLFLLSTRAGGLGINLASADTVILYDSDWNPQCDLQAQDRCHRIGQTSPVLVLRLITSSTIDEKMVERASAKRKLEKLIIQSGKFKEAKQSARSFDKALDEEELIALLKERDHDRIHRTTTGNVFSQEELDSLLDRSDMYGKGEQRKRSVKGVFKVMD